MSEIKFACPFCEQHIACDADYAGLSIECPSCGNTMVVPRLSAADPAHPSMVVVASTPAPAPRPDTSTKVPTLQAWTEDQWTQHSKDIRDEPSQMPNWIVCFFATLMISFALRLGRAGWWPVVGCLVAGGILSGVLLAKGTQSHGARNIVSGFAIVLAIVFLLPVVALAILFVGCFGCR